VPGGGVGCHLVDSGDQDELASVECAQLDKDAAAHLGIEEGETSRKHADSLTLSQIFAISFSGDSIFKDSVSERPTSSNLDPSRPSRIAEGSESAQAD